MPHSITFQHIRAVLSAQTEELAASFFQVTENNGDDSWNSACQIPVTGSSPNAAFASVGANRACLVHRKCPVSDPINSASGDGQAIF